MELVSDNKVVVFPESKLKDDAAMIRGRTICFWTGLDGDLTEIWIKLIKASIDSRLESVCWCVDFQISSTINSRR